MPGTRRPIEYAESRPVRAASTSPEDWAGAGGGGVANPLTEDLDAGGYAISNSPSALQRAQVTLTASQIGSLASTPIEVVADPGAGNFLPTPSLDELTAGIGVVTALMSASATSEFAGAMSVSALQDPGLGDPAADGTAVVTITYQTVTLSS